MRRIAFYGGSFDPVHTGHLAIAETLLEKFVLDEFWFVPAFHAPHKRDKKMSPAVCRYAMLALATQNEPRLKISTIELEAPERPFTIETLGKLKNHYNETADIFFVMGADSWNEITTWREWEKLLLLTNHIVVTRPNYKIETGHVTPPVCERIVDLRGTDGDAGLTNQTGIFITDAVNLDVSATAVRREIALQNDRDWRRLVSTPVAEYIEKYKLYSHQLPVGDPQNTDN
jgi:nicotinate-nucleotide adenylyltransferase